MTPDILFAIATIPVAALGLWKYRSDYLKKGSQTVLGLLAVCGALFMPHLALGYALPRVDFPETAIQWIGWALMVLGLALVAASMLNFRSGKKVLGMDTSKLETSGFYRVSRNPQCVFYVLFALGYALTGRSAMAFVAVALLCLALHVMVLIEEEHLKKVYGAEYKAYLKKTPRYLFF